MAQAFAATRACYSAVHVVNCLFVAAEDKSCQYDLVNNSWETLPHFLSSKQHINCLCAVDECIFAFSDSNLPQRYSVLKTNWQSGANFSFYNTSNSKAERQIAKCRSSCFSIKKNYVIHGYTRSELPNRGIIIPEQIWQLLCIVFIQQSMGTKNVNLVSSFWIQSPDKAYNVSFNEWKNMAEVMGDAVLCCLPVKKKT